MDTIVIGNNTQITVCRNPLTLMKTDYQFPEGFTIAQMLDITPFPVNTAISVSVNGYPIPSKLFKYIIPRAGDLVVAKMVPTGGQEGKDPLRVIMTLAVLAVGIMAPWGIAGMTGGNLLTFAGMGASSTISMYQAVAFTVGMLILNAVAPPPTPSALSNTPETYKDSPTYAISGAKNKFTPYGTIPCLLGKQRIFPPMGAIPYTENIGDDQWVRMILNIGHGPVTMEDFKLGETLLSQYAPDFEIEIKDGSDSSNTTLYPSDMFQDDLSIVLVNSNGWQQQTTQVGTTHISVDLTCARGLIQYDDQGNRLPVTVQAEFQYSLVGANDWKGLIAGQIISAQNVEASEPFWEGSGYLALVILDKISGVASILYGWAGEYPTAPDWAWPCATFGRVYGGAPEGLVDVRPAEFSPTGFGVTLAVGNIVTVAQGTLYTNVFLFTGKTTSTIRRTFYCPVPAAGQYDVRLRRVTTDTSDDKIIDEIMWTALRSYQTGIPITEPNMARVALRIKGTDKLNGVPDDFNLVAQSICLDYEAATNTWITRPTSNPASLYRYVLQGAANKRALTDAEIDLTTLALWHIRCNTYGWTFNHYVDYRSSVDAILQMIASAGRASPGYVDGKYSVVMDQPQTNIAQHFTPLNTWGYKYEKIFNEMPHGFKVKFWNKDMLWKEDEQIVYDDGYTSANATKFEELSLPGIDSAALSWSHGRYHIATARLRPEKHSFYCDFENLNCTRGDLVELNHDVIYAGLGYCHVKSSTNNGVNVLTITVDQQLTMETGKLYAFRIRQETGVSLLVNLQTVVGIATTFTVSGTLSLANAPDVGAMVLFGERGLEALDLIVQKIVPSNDLTAMITCVAAAPAVHTADIGPIPAFQTNISLPPARWQFYVPIIKEIRSNEDVMSETSTGELLARIAVSFVSQASISQGLIEKTQVRYRIAGTVNPYIYVESTTGEIYLTDGIYERETYTIEARYQVDGRWGKWCPARQETVVGQSSIPADVTNFRINVIDDMAFFSWTPVDASDLAGYVIKYTPATTGAVWTAGVLLGEMVDRSQASVIKPALTGTYMIKALDRGERESANAALIVNTTEKIREMNVAETIDEHPAFSGTKDKVIEADGDLILDCAQDMFELTNVFEFGDFFLTDQGFEELGYYYFNTAIDLGDIYVSRVSGSLLVAGVNYGSDFFWLGRRKLGVSGAFFFDFFAVDDIFGVVDSQWDAELEMRMTNDDPAGAPTWTDWAPLVFGDYSARAYEFRIRLESFAWGISPNVSEASVSVDMPDRIISGDDVVIPDTGDRIVFNPPYYGFKGVGIAAQGLATGDYYEITNKDGTGFDIIFKNAAGSGVQRTMDYVAAGYGRKIT